MINLDLLKEGGNAIPSSTPVKKEDVAGVVATAKRELPPALLKNIQVDIGSAGYKIESGDIDVMIEANDLVAVFKTQDDKKDPVLAAKKDSAQQLAEAEVIRAEGVAKANKIIGNSLKDNREYLQYLYITGIEDGAKNGNVTIYVPTEGGMPVPTLQMNK